ncbi:mechanosensitive ion channel family protein [Clostridium sp. DL1XJH146]
MSVLQEAFDSFNNTTTYIYQFITFNNLKIVIIALLIFLFFVLFRKIFTRYIFSRLLKISKKTKTNLDEIILISFEKPLSIFFTILGLYLSIKYLTSSFGYDITESVISSTSAGTIVQTSKFVSLFRSSIIILVALGLHNLSSENSNLYKNINKKLNLKVDNILLTFLSRIVRFIIIAFATCIIAEEFGFNVNSFITGLGIGGLAIALAAQDTLSNIFGGIVIILDRPFTIGDWIYTPTIEGTVEDITFRSTRIRTFANALVTVPNSNLADEAITNWSRMQKRRITFNLGVRYDTPKEKIEICTQKIRAMLTENNDVHKETIFVTFNEFNESSLDIFLYFFTNTTNWGDFLKVKENINFKILEILENEKVEIAYPSRSIFLEKEPS